MNNVRISEFPKSGGTWLGLMLSDLFSLEFPRNRPLPIKRCIQHAHFGGPFKQKTIVLVRDGRDVLTSAYFHFLLPSQKKPSGLVKYWRKMMGNVNFENVEETMPVFISVFTENYKAGFKNISWSDHVMSYANDPMALIIRYEDLLHNAENELQKISKWIGEEPKKPISGIVSKYKFEVLANRNPGEEDRQSFYRKGISGDWKNYFSNEAIEVFNKYHSEGLRYYNYD